VTKTVAPKVASLFTKSAAKVGADFAKKGVVKTLGKYAASAVATEVAVKAGGKMLGGQSLQSAVGGTIGETLGGAVNTTAGIATNAVGGLLKGLIPDELPGIGTILKIGGMGIAGILGIPKIIGAIGAARDKRAAQKAAQEAAADQPAQSDSNKELIEMMKMQMMMNMQQNQQAMGTQKMPQNNFTKSMKFQ
jgi:hypothetical protein